MQPAVQKEMRKVARNTLRKVVAFVNSVEMTPAQKWLLYSETEKHLWWLCGSERGERPYLKPVGLRSPESGPMMYQDLFSFAETEVRLFMKIRGVQMSKFCAFDFCGVNLRTGAESDMNWHTDITRSGFRMMVHLGFGCHRNRIHRPESRNR